MKEIALPTTDFAENAGMTVSRVSAVLWCFARNIYRKGEQRKMIENEMTVSVPLEVVKASEIEPKEVKWLWYPYAASAAVQAAINSITEPAVAGSRFGGAEQQNAALCQAAAQGILGGLCHYQGQGHRAAEPVVQRAGRGPHPDRH